MCIVQILMQVIMLHFSEPVMFQKSEMSGLNLNHAVEERKCFSISLMYF